jgi:hypothetical protein
VGLVYDPSKLLGVMTARSGVGGLLHCATTCPVWTGLLTN